MGAGVVHTSDLDDFVAEVDRLGGLKADAAVRFAAGFRLAFDADVDTALDPFSGAYFARQEGLYREIAGRPLDQAEGERVEFDVAAHAAGGNPYNSPDIGFIARHCQAVHTCLMAADLPPGAAVLDLGCGWGLTAEQMAFAGARVTAVDINPPFADLVGRRAARLGLPITAVAADFDAFADGRTYDLVLFCVCLHHSLRPWVTLARAAAALNPGGKVVCTGEPIGSPWWPHWGLRLDHESVYCMRKYGWWESGWSADFLGRCHARAGLALTVVPGAGLDGGPLGFAVRTEDAGRVVPHPSVAGSEAELAALRREAAALRREVGRLHRHVADMQSSMSWRAAGAVRAAGRVYRRLRRPAGDLAAG